MRKHRVPWMTNKDMKLPESYEFIYNLIYNLDKERERRRRRKERKASH